MGFSQGSFNCHTLVIAANMFIFTFEEGLKKVCASPAWLCRVLDINVKLPELSRSQQTVPRQKLQLYT